MVKAPEQITERLYRKSIDALHKPAGELALGGVLAGVFVALAASTSLTVCSDLAQYMGIGFTKLISGIVFSLGLILIVLSGSELFTGSNLFFVAVFDRAGNISRVLKYWAVVYIANFAGSLLLVWLTLQSGIFNDDIVKAYILQITRNKLNLTFSQAFIRGILCNFLVCLAVRVGESSDEISGKILGFIYVISAFVINSFEHSIANMFFIPLGIQVGKTAGMLFSWESFLVDNLLPVTLGNVVGGALFVGTVYYILHRRYWQTTNPQVTETKSKNRKGENRWKLPG